MTDGTPRKELQNRSSDKLPEVYKVIGAPGTGKTTRVVGNPELGIDGLFIENSDDYDLEEQKLVTYTNAGVDEATERLHKMIDAPKYKIEESVTTIHSACYSLLNEFDGFDGLERRQIVMHNNKRNFCNKHGLEFGYEDDEQDMMGADLEEGNALFRIYSWLQSNRKTLSEWEDCPVAADWEHDQDAQMLLGKWEEYKTKNNLVGFGDMIDYVVELGFKQLSDAGLGYLFPDDNTSKMEMFKKASNDERRVLEELRGKGAFIDSKVLYVDEAQDLTPLQWSWYLLQKCVVEKAYVGGDEDQCIYGWSGAKPGFLLNEEGEFELLETTYRIPKQIWKICNGVIQQVDERQQKDVKPDGQDGEFITLNRPSHRNLCKELVEGEWMILFRAKYQINEFTESLHKFGIPYRNMSTFDKWSDDIVKLRDALAKIESDDKTQLKGDEVHVMTEFAEDSMIHDNDLSATDKVMGQFGGISIDEVKDMFELRDSYRELELTAKNYLSQSDEIDYYEKEAILGNIRAGYTDLKPERVRIGTIHSAKGKEAENVLVATDSTKTILDNMAEDLENINAGVMDSSPITDAERRVYYVGMTRASEKLILAEGVIDPETSISINSLLAEEHEADMWKPKGESTSKNV